MAPSHSFPEMQNAPNRTDPSASEDETYFVRREGCGNPDRCGEKVCGIDERDLWLAWCSVAGAA